ncbi:hypothetical protein DH2020_045703 [Rehmannia glutinosa]|uniref:Retrotransposon Copia-like N-terminal domain-containing protein n=1 Tax=Rehmannia glutinosa TaxID=99300 RepID=A0ABR0UF44_REHGL
MERGDVSQPISFLLDGSNYVPWAQVMTSFLKGRKLWRIFIGSLMEPKQQKDEAEFGCFDTSKEVWDFLAKRYSAADGAHQYQLATTLHYMCQEPGQPINNFLSQIHTIWDQLTASEPTWECNADAEKFANWRDRSRLVQFLMALHDDFEPVRASLLYRCTFPTLDQAVQEVIIEETQLHSRKS